MIAMRLTLSRSLCRAILPARPGAAFQVARGSYAGPFRPGPRLPNGPAREHLRPTRHGGPSPTSVRGRRPLAAPGRTGQDGSEPNGTEGSAAVMLFAIVLALTIGCIAFILVRPGRGVPRPDGLRGWIRARGWGLLLLPVAMAAAVMAGGLTAYPGRARHRGPGHRLRPEAGRQAGALSACSGWPSSGSCWPRRTATGTPATSSTCSSTRVPEPGAPPPVLAEAGVLFVVGLWLLLRLDAPGAGLVRALAARWLDRRRGGISAVHGLLLIPVVALACSCSGPTAGSAARSPGSTWPSLTWPRPRPRWC